MTSKREKKIQQRVTMILEAAANLVQRVGYANMNIEMVIEEVGIARATLYQHFSNKEDIVLHALLRSMDNLENHLLAPYTSPIEHLENVIRFIIKGDQVNDRLIGVMTNDELRNIFWGHEEVNKRYVRVFQQFDQLFNETKASGHVDHELSNEVLLGMIFGISNVASFQPSSPDHPGQFDLMVNQCVKVFLRGIRP